MNINNNIDPMNNYIISSGEHNRREDIEWKW